MTLPEFAPSPAVWLIALPLLWGSIAFLLEPGRGARLALVGISLQLLAALWLALHLPATGSQHLSGGGWAAPLGIALAVDGLAAVMLLLTQFIALPLALYACSYFQGSPAVRQFWPLFGLLLAGLNALFVSADLFNLYVTLELVGLAAVGLTVGSGGASQLAAALRYLFATLLGSGLYLLGVALIYGTYGTVSLATLTPLLDVSAPLAVWLAGSLMLAGLALKSALFPLHYWLPPAHGGAPAPVSALLSALVVKASFYLILRLWLGPFAPLVDTLAWLPAALGAGAVLYGSFMAIRAVRLKMLVAYSTVAQLGYLFLLFPLLQDNPAALSAGVMQVVAHGLAKAAMFMAAGVLILAAGKDTVAATAAIASRLPVTLWAFALAGVSLMGLPPSGGFLAKWLLIEAALAQGYWLIALVTIAGGLLAAVYVFRFLRLSFERTEQPQPLTAVPPVLQWTAFGLAAASVLLGLRGVELLRLLGVGAAS